MKTELVTPMILTWNEENNIGACLDRLTWAREVLIVDSFSSDRTLDLCQKIPQVKIVQRAMDSHAEQCNFGMQNIQTPWVLALDADYMLPSDFASTLKSLSVGSEEGFSSEFRYAVFGKLLRGSLYPPRIVLHRREGVRYYQDGHTQRVLVNGPVGKLGTHIVHDDRKSLSRWLSSQARYADLEADKLLGAKSEQLSLQDRLRTKIWVAPFLVAFWCFVVRGCLLDGRAGLYYTFQRVLAELMLSLCLLDRHLRRMMS